jgi:hypothetical protein
LAHKVLTLSPLRLGVAEDVQAAAALSLELLANSRGVTLRRCQLVCQTSAAALLSQKLLTCAAMPLLLAG